MGRVDGMKRGRAGLDEKERKKEKVAEKLLLAGEGRAGEEIGRISAPTNQDPAGLLTAVRANQSRQASPSNLEVRYPYIHA